MSQPSQRWSQLDHSWHVAYWLHRALLRYARRVDKPADADVIFVAHYFLHENPSSDPLFFGPPLLEWHTALERGGPAGLFGNDSTLLQRWRQRSADFVVAPVLLACKHARGWLRAARWVIIDPFFDNACGYQHNFDIVAPYVPSDKWEARLPPEATTTTPNAFSRPRAHFALYAGRLGKAYLDYPRTLLRQRLWAVLRRHPNCTFWATDVPEAIAPFVSLPAERCGPRCSFGCHECLDMPPGADLATGSVRRIAPAAYRQLMRNATYCLVVRGDTHSTRKFSEAILAGCVPVLIADMPAWPFARRLRYDEFTFEFDWRLALRRPSAVLQALLRVTPAELEAKRRALQRVRRHFMYHDEPTTSGATRQLLADVCTAPRRSDRQRTLTDVYNRRPMHGRELMHEFQCAAADPSSSHASAVPACSPSPSAHQMPGAGDAFEHAPDDELTPPLANKAAVGGTTNASWVAGYCTAAEQTEYDCERGQKGSWSMPKTAIVGSLEQAASWVAADKGDPHVVRLAHASLRRHVLLANPHARCDVYLHSWNPSLKALIDRTYAPVWSAHEPERHGVGKVVSAMLSLRAALEAKRWRELHVLRAPYDLVLAARLDLVWYRPLVFSQLPRAQLWLAAQCCNVDEAYLDGLAVPARRSRSDANAAADGAAAAPSQHLRAGSSRSELERLVAVTRNECLGTDGDIEALCTTSRFLRMSGGDAAMAPEAEYNYYVNDWLFLAPSATADTFAALTQRRAAYVGALREVGIRVDYLHFHWSAHIHHALRVAAGVRPALLAGVEVHMARAAHLGRACRANRIVELPTVRAPVWGGMQHALCPTAGRVICPWASHHCAAHALEGVGVAYAR